MRTIYYALPSVQVTNSSQKKKVLMEIRKIQDRFQELEAQFIETIAKDQWHDYDSWYKGFMAAHNSLLQWHYKNHKFRLSKPNTHAFHERYAPAEKAYTNTTLNFRNLCLKFYNKP